MRGTYLILLIGALSIPSSEAQCGSCPIKHPQQHYCDSMFATKLTILDEDRYDTDIPNTKLYTAEILKSWKRGPAGGEFQFYVPASFCGAIFTVGETYVVTGTREVDDGGRKYWLHGSCDYKSAWDDMSDRQKTGFKKDYMSHCDKCTVHVVWAPSDVLVEDITVNDNTEATTYWTPTNCYYNPQKTQYYVSRPGSEVEDCEDVYGLCRQNRAGECQWQMTAEYQSCFKYRDDFVMVDSGKFAITDESQCEVYTNKRKRKSCQKKARRHQEGMGNEQSYILPF